MNENFLLVIVGSAIINYVLRGIPVIFKGKKEPSKFIKSFLEYIPYAALGALLFPDILYSTKNIFISIGASIFAGFLILKRQNMLFIVISTIALVFFMGLKI
ncbi:MAG: branched-chain amino acid transport [Fusobacteriia bacterium 4572_132]|nr:MAG: branched-chain amino acid transport [Fusobacteriia bacterium 4572_132]